MWCRLPNESGKPGETVRPALVRGSKRELSTGRCAVWVSYGTAHLQVNERNDLDLIIQNAERLHQLDLPHAVRFDLGRFNWLPWASEFFAAPEHSLYMVAGPLSDMERRRLRERLRRRGIIQEL